MLIQPTLDTLNQLKLHGMAAALSEQLTQSAALGLPFEDRLGLLVEREVSYRENRRLTRLLQVAQLKERAALEDLDFRARRGLDRAQLASLASCEPDPRRTQSSDSRGHRVRQDLPGLRAGPPGLPPGPVRAVPARPAPVR